RTGRRQRDVEGEVVVECRLEDRVRARAHDDLRAARVIFPRRLALDMKGPARRRHVLQRSALAEPVPAVARPRIELLFVPALTETDEWTPRRSVELLDGQTRRRIHAHGHAAKARVLSALHVLTEADEPQERSRTKLFVNNEPECADDYCEVRTQCRG